MCPSVVPEACAPTAPVHVQSWLHSIFDEWNYKSTWADEAEALHLAFEVGFASIGQAASFAQIPCKLRFGMPDQCRPPATKPGSILKSTSTGFCSASPSLKFPQLVHFADEVEIAFSSRSDKPIVKAVLKIDQFDSWCNKPWAYRPTQQSINLSDFVAWRLDVIANEFKVSSLPMPLSHLVRVQHRIIDHHIARPNLVSDNAENDQRGFIQPVGPPEPLPDFARQILERTDEVMIPVHNDWDLGVTTRTWFLHHHTAPRCEIFRMIQLVGDATTWLQQIWNAWHDRISPGDALVVHIVNPPPPRPWRDRHIAIDLILSQGLGSDHLPGLGVVRFANDPQGDRQFCVAASLPPLLSGFRLLHQFDFTHFCDIGDCTLHYGWNTLPLNDAALHQTRAGDSFVVFVNDDDHNNVSNPPCRVMCLMKQTTWIVTCQLMGSRNRMRVVLVTPPPRILKILRWKLIRMRSIEARFWCIASITIQPTCMSGPIPLKLQQLKLPPF